MPLDDDTHRLLDLDQARARALVESDIATLERITADGYSHVETNGTVRGKADFLDSLRRGDVRFDTFVIEASHVRIFGDTAVLTGSYHDTIRTPQGAQRTKHARHIRVYVRTDGCWRAVAHQATEIGGH